MIDNEKCPWCKSECSINEDDGIFFFCCSNLDCRVFGPSRNTREEARASLSNYKVLAERNYLKARVEKLRGALSLYANYACWRMPSWGGDFDRITEHDLYILETHDGPMIHGGKRARAALAEDDKEN